EWECAGEAAMADNIMAPEPPQIGQVAHIAARGAAAWTSTYLPRVMVAEGCCGLAAGLSASKFDSAATRPEPSAISGSGWLCRCYGWRQRHSRVFTSPGSLASQRPTTVTVCVD